MFAAFFTLGAQSASRQSAFRRLVVAHLLFLCGAVWFAVKGRPGDPQPPLLPRRAGQRGVSENPWTVSSNPRSLRETVVILDRHTSVSGCTRSAISRASDSSGANTAFAGAADTFQE